MEPIAARWEIRANDFMDDFEIWEGDRQIAGQLRRENAEAIVAAMEKQGASVDLIWETQKDDVFNVVADIDLPSARIEYAFKAGYLAAEVQPHEPEVCRPCQANDHGHCYYWGRRRSWAPCGCKDEQHHGEPVPVYR